MQLKHTKAAVSTTIVVKKAPCMRRSLQYLAHLAATMTHTRLSLRS